MNVNTCTIFFNIQMPDTIIGATGYDEDNGFFSIYEEIPEESSIEIPGIVRGTPIIISSSGGYLRSNYEEYIEVFMPLQFAGDGYYIKAPTNTSIDNIEIEIS